MVNQYRVVKLLDFERYRVEVWDWSWWNWKRRWIPAKELVVSYADVCWEKVKFDTKAEACRWIEKTRRYELEWEHRDMKLWAPVCCGEETPK